MIEHLAPIHYHAARDRLTNIKGPNGDTEYLGVRIEFDTIKPHFKRGSEPAGASQLSWKEFIK